MGQKLPWVTTLGQKTLEPYYKCIVKGSPKIHFSSFFHFVITLGHSCSQVFTYSFYIISTPYHSHSVRRKILRTHIETIGEPTRGEAQHF